MAARVLALAWLGVAAAQTASEQAREVSGEEVPIRLKCFYSLKKGTNAGGGIFELGAVICPEGHDNYCVKEVAEGLDEADCGMTEFFGDTFDDTTKECILRKCASQCEEGTAFWNSELGTRRGVQGGQELQEAHLLLQDRLLQRGRHPQPQTRPRRRRSHRRRTPPPQMSLLR